MRVLISHKLPYSKGHAGATRTIRSIVRLLAERGHDTVVVCRDSFAGEVSDQGELSKSLSSALTNDRGNKIYALPGSINFEKALLRVFGLWNPNCVIICEDPTFLSLAIALEQSAKRVILLTQSQSTLPFGPEAFYPDKNRAKLLKPPVEIIVLSKYVREYVRRWGQLEPTLLPHLLRDQLEKYQVGSFDNTHVTFINASQIKGLTIFIGLAKRFPSVNFAAVKGWATTSDDINKLQKLNNVAILEPSEDVDEIYSQTRVLLVPSLWGEAFGYVALEAMMRGIPVLASNLGGLPEAKLGVDYLLPANPILDYHQSFDDRLLPKPIIPKQNLDPWVNALHALINDKSRYESLADISRIAAIEYIESLEVNRWEEFFEDHPES